MEGCLKKLVLEAQATGFQGPKKGAGSRWDRLRENSCSEGSTGGKGVYIRYRREAKKFIPDKCVEWYKALKIVAERVGIGERASIDLTDASLGGGFRRCNVNNNEHNKG